MQNGFIGVLWTSQTQDLSLKQSLETSHPQKSIVVDNDRFFLLSDKTDLLFQPVYNKDVNALFLGRLFQKNNFIELKEEQIKKILEVPHTIFQEKYWGSYIKIEEMPNEFSVTRDPTGNIPFFYKNDNNKNILFSNKIYNLQKLPSEKASFNWDYMAAYMMCGNLTSNYTPFMNIYELPVGCKLVYNLIKSSSELFLDWNPINYIGNEAKITSDFQEQMMFTLQEVIRGWSRPYQSLSVDFSGGLDSTAILLSINKVFAGNKKITGINIFHPDIESSNELKYARKIVKDIGIELIEFDSTDYLPFSEIEACSYMPDKPSLMLIFLKQELALQSLRSLNKNNLHVWGQGGDHIFMGRPPFGSLIDCLIKRDFKETCRKSSELAMYYRSSLFPVLSNTLSSLTQYIFKTYYNQKIRGFEKVKWHSKKMLENFHVNKFIHPFYNTRQRILPGKFEHINAIYEALTVINIPSNHAFSPLLFQPLLEFALKLPTYDLYNEEFDRYPFRLAVSNHFNTDTVWRKDKGEISGVMRIGLNKNKDYCFDLCLNGELVKNNFICRKELEKDLKAYLHGVAENQFAILQLISLESFIKLWKNIN